MFTQKPKLLLSFFGCCLLATVSFTSCNNEEKKEPEKVETPTPAVTNDSPKINTTVPVAEPAKKDSMVPKDTLKKGGMKPVNTKPAPPPPSGT